VVVCDDASTDSTFELCERFAKTHPNFRVFRNKENLGWLKTSELLWEIGARESVFCFSNPHDDHPLPAYVSNLVNLLQDEPKAVVAIPGMRNNYSDGVVIDSFFSAVSGPVDLSSRILMLANRQVHHWWSAYHGLHRSTAVAKILPIKSLPFGEPEYSVDLIWIIKMAIQGEFITNNQIDLIKYYRTESVSAKWRKGIINRLALWVAIIQELKKADIPRSETKKIQSQMLRLLEEKIKRRLPFYRKR
ncbi:MAG: glycosyltransferase, partial [Algoriphagus sp.]|nr:glycosyltransferase [Algoriphagus sp.]